MRFVEMCLSNFMQRFGFSGCRQLSAAGVADQITVHLFSVCSLVQPLSTSAFEMTLTGHSYPYSMYTERKRSTLRFRLPDTLLSI